MDGYIWLEKYKNNPEKKEFRQLFGGRFMINPDGNGLFYETDDGTAYILEEDDTEFWNKLCQSVKIKKNLFLDNEKY